MGPRVQIHNHQSRWRSKHSWIVKKTTMLLTLLYFTWYITNLIVGGLQLLFFKVLINSRKIAMIPTKLQHVKCRAKSFCPDKIAKK